MSNKSPFQQRQDAIMANAPKEHKDWYDKANKGLDVINKLLNQPSVSNKDLTNSIITLMQHGTVTPRKAAQYISDLTTSDNSPIPKINILKEIVPLADAKNQVVMHNATAQAQNPQQVMQ